mmetsp:Transcript_78825/g.223003  ORF Transcript_78825/g.223003 Transcript_78825/m.223003 type:complete len:201 (+) Transcript_78825:100-702(+)
MTSRDGVLPTCQPDVGPQQVPGVAVLALGVSSPRRGGAEGLVPSQHVECGVIQVAGAAPEAPADHGLAEGPQLPVARVPLPAGKAEGRTQRRARMIEVTLPQQHSPVLDRPEVLAAVVVPSEVRDDRVNGQELGLVIVEPPPVRGVLPDLLQVVAIRLLEGRPLHPLHDEGAQLRQVRGLHEQGHRLHELSYPVHPEGHN